jgi:hypothetical protein
MAAPRRPSAAKRSKKAGKPPVSSVAPPRVRRRAKTAHAAFRKDTTTHEAPEGTRALWPASRPMWKKG